MMNEQEAIKSLKNIIEYWTVRPTEIEAAKKAIEALEKQTPKKIDRVGNKCPICKCYLASEPIEDHCCFSCGQAIDWSQDDN